MENIKLIIDEGKDNLKQDNLVHICKYRYTFMKSVTTTEQEISIFQSIFRFIKDNYCAGVKIVGGIEHYTKGFIAAKHHLHIHFYTKDKGDTIRKGLARAMPEHFIGRLQCAKMEVLARDEDKLFRYPLKQQKNESKVHAQWLGFTKEEIQTLRDVAYECWLQGAEIHINKLEKKIERNSEDRLFAHLDKKQELEKFTSYHEVIKYSMIYFAEYETVFNRQTIIGYTDKWMLLREVITYQRYIEMNEIKNYNL